MDSRSSYLPPPNKLFFVRSSAADSAWRTSSPLLCWSNENIMKETGGKVLQKKIPLIVIFIIKYSPKQYEAKSKSAMIKHFRVRMVHQTISWSLSRRKLPERRNDLSRPEKTSGLCRFPSPRSKHRPWVPKGRKEPKSTGFHERLKNCLKDSIILPSLLRMWRWAG